MTEQHLQLAKLLLSALVVLVLILAMTWIVLSPVATDEAAKAALVIVGTAVGFVFGRETKP